MSSFYFYGPTTLGGQTTFAPDGTAAAPGYAFAGESNTGLFRPASGVVALTGAGVEVARFSATLAQIPAASVLTWNGHIKAGYVTDANFTDALQLTNNAGANGVLLLGPATTAGVRCFNNAGVFQVSKGDNSANTSVAAAQFQSTTSNAIIWGDTNNTGIGLRNSGTMGRVIMSYLGNDGFGIDSNSNLLLTPNSGTNNSATMVVQSTRFSVTTNSGALTQVIGAIPAGALVAGVVARVTTVITGCTSFSIGDGTTANKWGAGILVAANTTSASAQFLTKTALTAYTGSENVTLTAAGGGAVFTTGVVECIVYYFTLTAPTS